MGDNVNQPKHYTTGNIEVIEIIKDILTAEMYEGYCVGNVQKYIARYRNKGGVEDLKKAAVYLDWGIKVAEERENGNRA
ncbi:DUF3310 domain-containing protein [Bacillus niameyensis]|uniref:DUF3310 domain-containing protein n=1 Tax=Bacillus niameyensis TaxID=1522308 RepID=UPI000A6870CF|nr:DUF3310 domain-containing protein [Bacillus niameyensis]